MYNLRAEDVHRHLVPDSSISDKDRRQALTNLLPSSKYGDWTIIEDVSANSLWGPRVERVTFGYTGRFSMQREGMSLTGIARTSFQPRGRSLYGVSGLSFLIQGASEIDGILISNTVPLGSITYKKGDLTILGHHLENGALSLWDSTRKEEGGFLAEGEGLEKLTSWIEGIGRASEIVLETCNFIAGYNTATDAAIEVLSKDFGISATRLRSFEVNKMLSSDKSPTYLGEDEKWGIAPNKDETLFSCPLQIRVRTEQDGWFIQNRSSRLHFAVAVPHFGLVEAPENIGFGDIQVYVGGFSPTDNITLMTELGNQMGITYHSDHSYNSQGPHDFLTLHPSALHVLPNVIADLLASDAPIAQLIRQHQTTTAK